MAQKSAKNMIGHLHRGKAREKIDNNNNNNFGRILGMVTSSSSIKAWLVWDYDRNASYLTWLFQKDIPLKLSQICEQ